MLLAALLFQNPAPTPLLLHIGYHRTSITIIRVDCALYCISSRPSNLPPLPFEKKDQGSFDLFDLLVFVDKRRALRSRRNRPSSTNEKSRFLIAKHKQAMGAIKFGDPEVVHTHEIPRLEDTLIDELFYQEDEIGTFYIFVAGTQNPDPKA